MSDTAVAENEGGGDVAPISSDDIDLLNALDVGEEEAPTKDEKQSAKEEAEPVKEEAEPAKEEVEPEPTPKRAKKAAPVKEEAEPAEDEGPKWYDDIKDEDARSVASEFDSREELLKSLTDLQKALGIEATDDWRQSIKDDKLREHATRFNSPTELAKAHMELRTRLSTALVPPDKTATKEERQAFADRLSKMLGVPEDPKGYEFPTQEGVELSPAELKSQENWAEFFHDIHLPKRQAEAILSKFAQEIEVGKEELAKADKHFAEKVESELRSEWGPDNYETNRTLAQRTAKELFADDFDNIMKSTTGDGRLLMDSPYMLRMLARVGREMNEGSVDLMTDAEKETVHDQVADYRKRAAEATRQGDTRLANSLYKKEQDLLEKISGKEPIVGSRGRTA